MKRKAGVKRLYRAEVETTRVLYLLADDDRDLHRQVLTALKEAEQSGTPTKPTRCGIMQVKANHRPDGGWDRRCLIYGDTGGADVRLGEALEKFTQG